MYYYRQEVASSKPYRHLGDLARVPVAKNGIQQGNRCLILRACQFGKGKDTHVSGAMVLTVKMGAA